MYIFAIFFLFPCVQDSLPNCLLAIFFFSKFFKYFFENIYADFAKLWGQYKEQLALFLTSYSSVLFSTFSEISME